MRESQIEDYFIEQVEQHDGITRKCRWLCRRGAPDRWAGFRKTRRSAFAEIKAPGKPLKSHQEREGRKLREAGQLVYTIDSYEAVDAFIREMTA